MTTRQNDGYSAALRLQWIIATETGPQLTQLGVKMWDLINPEYVIDFYNAALKHEQQIAALENKPE